MKNQVMVTVIVPVYSPPEENLKGCLQSLANQDYENYEVILVNDGDSLDLDFFCRKFCAGSNRFKVINQEHKGVSAARNAGIAMALGEYICFCDADDYVLSDFLSVMEQCMDGVDLVICGVAGQYFPVVDSEIKTEDFFSHPCIYNNVPYTNFCTNKMYKTAILREENIRFDESVELGEDALFLSDYVRHCRKIKTVQKGLYYYVCNEKSAVNTFHQRFWDWEKRVIECQLKQFTFADLDMVDRQYMKYWAFCKIRLVLNYYGRKEAEEATRRKVFWELRRSEVYAYLYSYSLRKENSFFKTLDVIQLILWKTLGLTTSARMKSYIRNVFCGVKK